MGIDAARADEIVNHTIGRATNTVLNKATAVVFKDEDETDDGQPVGPVWIRTRTASYPYHRPDGIEWFPRSFATELAAALGIKFEES